MTTQTAEADYLEKLAARIADGQAPTVEDVLAFQEAEHPYADEIYTIWESEEDERRRARRQASINEAIARQDGDEAEARAARAAAKQQKQDISQRAQGAPSAAKAAREAPPPCPALDSLTLAQVAFYDNGPQKTSRDPVTGKRKNAKPQFMTKIQAWTTDPRSPEFNFRQPTWERAVLMFRHRELPKKLRDWMTPDASGETSISQEMHDRLKALWDDTDVDRKRDMTMFGLFMHNVGGRRFNDNQFIVTELEHGHVNYGLLFLDAGDPIRLDFAAKLVNQSALPRNICGQARFDPRRNYFHPEWATCWL